MLQALKSKSKRIAATLAAGVLLFSQFAAIPTVGATNTDNTNDWPYWCSANYDGGVKFDRPTDDTENGIKADFSADDEEVDITSVDANKTVKLVVVKAGSSGGDDGKGNEVYNTSPFNNLIAPFRKDISHVIVCYDEVETGDIKVKKYEDVNGNSQLSPGENDDMSGWKIRLYSSNWTYLQELTTDDADWRTFDDLALGTYYLCEKNQTGWVQTDPNGSDGSSVANNSPKKNEEAARCWEVTLTSNNKTREVYFGNQQVTLGNVKVNKKVDTDGNGSYEGGNTTANTLGFGWGLDAETPARDMGTTASSVTTGSHTVTENIVNGYSFTGWYFTAEEDNYGEHQTNCAHPQGTTLPVNITVEKDKTKEVTFCNQVKTGSITIIKDAQPNSTQDFDFNINQDGSGLYDNFELEDDGSNNDGEKNYKTFDDLVADQYVITEAGENGWKLTDITCSDGANVVINKADRKVTVTLGHEDNVTCTFVNQKKGKIKVYKHTDPSGDQTNFAIEATTQNGTIYSDPTRYIADGEHEEFWVGFGTYDVDETVPAGWAQASNTCEEIVINAENLYAECHIYNTKEAKLTIVKQAYPANGQDFMFTTNNLGDFTLDVDADATYEDNRQFSGLAADVYTVSEQTVANWELAYAYCDNDEQNYQMTDANTLAIQLFAGDHVTCTFVNVEQNTVSGHKFNDANGNGVWDQGEAALAGWTIELTDECEADDRVRSLLDVTEEDNDLISDCGQITKYSNTPASTSWRGNIDKSSTTAAVPPTRYRNTLATAGRRARSCKRPLFR